MNALEAEILKSINSLVSCDALDMIFKFISALGDKGAIWIVLTVVLCAFPKTRKAGFCMAVSLLFCLIIGNGVLKPLFGRVRPYDFDPEIHIIVKPLKDSSFPSGHTMAAFAFSASAARYYKRFGKVLYASALLMGLSRIYLCVHYPTDVISGALFGILFAAAAIKICERFKHI